MVFWMRTAARTISGELKGKLDKALDLGPFAIALVAFLGVGREGLETAIFFYATTEAAGAGNNQPLIGWVIGLGGAVLLGWLIYRGAVQINLGKFFRYTGILLILVAAGILSYGIHDLQEARFLPGLTTLAFDVSATVDPSSWYATLLKGIFNFTPATTVLQAVAWVLYVGTVMFFFLRPTSRPSPPAPPGGAGSRADPQSPQRPRPTGAAPDPLALTPLAPSVAATRHPQEPHVPPVPAPSPRRRPRADQRPRPRRLHRQGRRDGRPGRGDRRQRHRHRVRGLAHHRHGGHRDVRGQQRRDEGQRVLRLREGDRIISEVENITPGLTRDSTSTSPSRAPTRPRASPAWWATASAPTSR